MEAAANNPKDAGYLANEGEKDHLDFEKSTEWVEQRATPIVSDQEKREAFERIGMHVEWRRLQYVDS